MSPIHWLEFSLALHTVLAIVAIFFAARVEGYKTAEWILLDYGDFIVHVFEQKSRSFYDLERLWRESTRVALPAEMTGEGPGSLRRES